MKILLADDDREMADLMCYAFKRDGHTAVTAFDGEEALRLFGAEAPDVVILDVSMPKRDGLHVLQALRQHSQVPVLMLTALGDEDHVVNAFRSGADDYLTKPFRPRELKVRIDALVRRNEASLRKPDPVSKVVTCGELTIDVHRRVVTVTGRPVQLTRKEFDLLHHLLLHKGMVLSVPDILVHVWGYDADESEDIVKVTVSRLRHKIEQDPSQPRYIKTSHGAGYILECDL